MNGHPSDNLHTYGMVQGMIGCGFSLGSTIGPIFSGALTDILDYAWVGTILAGVNFLMVSSRKYVLFSYHGFIVLVFHRVWCSLNPTLSSL